VHPNASIAMAIYAWSSDPMKISVVIAVFNASSFLGNALESALSQTLEVFEVILIDDASTDDTLQVARLLAAKDSRVRVVGLATNGGPSVARNRGIEEASGDWIVVCDADDAMLPNRLERMTAAAMSQAADVVVDNFAWVDPVASGAVSAPGIRVSAVLELVSLARFIKQARPYTDEADWGLLKPMFRKAFLDEHGLRYPTHSRHGEDYLLMIELLRRGGRYVLVREIGYLYTARSSGHSRTRIDYAQMARDSAALLGHADIRADPTLSRLVHERVRAVRRLDAEYRVRVQMHDRRLVSVCTHALRDRFVAVELLRFVWRKLRRAF
jgi:succinoglycan biosynthesis protein ExoO